MKAKNANILTLLLFSVVLQMTVLNTAQANDDEIEADFLEFLADMEEATGSGFDVWINDTAIDENENYNSANTDAATESTELQK